MCYLYFKAYSANQTSKLQAHCFTVLIYSAILKMVTVSFSETLNTSYVLYGIISTSSVSSATLSLTRYTGWIFGIIAK
jgi:hypothetical protein